MTVEWSPRAVATASRLLVDGEGMQAVVAALDALAGDPYPAQSFQWGEMLRLRVGRYRVMYVIEDDLITIERVDRVGGSWAEEQRATPVQDQTEWQIEWQTALAGACPGCAGAGLCSRSAWSAVLPAASESYGDTW